MTDDKRDVPRSDDSALPDSVGREHAEPSPQPQSVDGPATANDPSNPSEQFKNRRAGLIAFGILQIAMGGCAALLILLMSLSLRNNAMSVQMIIPAIGVYSQFVVVLVWLGIGSILARRWARAVTLVLAWAWLVFGIIAMIYMAWFLPIMSNMMAAEGQVPPGGMVFFQGIMLAMMGCMYFVLPGIFVLFYQSKHVKATCEFADPHIRWTDKCPLPVLALSLLLGYGAISMIFSGGYGGVIPFFGFILKGLPGVVVIVGCCLLFAYLAWATYRLKMAAWWTTLIAYAFSILSTIITFLRIDLMDFYREMNFPEEQLKMIEKSGMIEQMNMPLLMVAGSVPILGYLLWVRRYFVDASISRPDS